MLLYFEDCGITDDEKMRPFVIMCFGFLRVGFDFELSLTSDSLLTSRCA